MLSRMVESLARAQAARSLSRLSQMSPISPNDAVTDASGFADLAEEFVQLAIRSFRFGPLLFRIHGHPVDQANQPAPMKRILALSSPPGLSSVPSQFVEGDFLLAKEAPKPACLFLTLQLRATLRARGEASWRPLIA